MQTETSSPVLVRAQGLVKHFNGIRALDDVSCGVPAGSITGIIGPNGAGKSTLLDILSGHMMPDLGDVLIGGQAVTIWRPEVLALRVPGVARTFQEVRLFEHLALLDNVLLGLHFRAGTTLGGIFRRRAISRELVQKTAVALEALDVVGMKEARFKRPYELSYGQRKLAEIARCLAAPQAIMLLDEPFAGVHHSLFAPIMTALRFARDQRAKTIVLIEHNLGVIRELCDYLIALESGKVISEGPVVSGAEETEIRNRIAGGGLAWL